MVHHQPGTLIWDGVSHLAEGLRSLAEETAGVIAEAHLVVDIALQVVTVTQPAVSLFCTDVLQLVLETVKCSLAGVQIPGEVALQGLQLGLQRCLTLSTTDDKGVRLRVMKDSKLKKEGQNIKK